MELRQDSLRIDLMLIVQSQDKQMAEDKQNATRETAAVTPSVQKPPSGRYIISSYESQGSHVRVEVHPKTSRPQLLNRPPTPKDVPVPTRNGSTLEQMPQPSAKDFYAYPWDKSCLKSMPVNLKNLEKLDAHAVQVSATSTVEELVRTLLKLARTDVERVRAIWMWVCHHIEYDLEGLEDKSKWSSDPSQILLRGKGACEGYAGLFENMCRLAGIQCVKIGGYSKGLCYVLGQTFSEETNHAWNAVYLNKKWHLLDTTWGAGIADRSSNKFNFRYNEFYFLTHPALFIEEHFPDNQNWQLLQVPLSLKQFEGNLCRKSSFYNAGLIASFPETLQVETVNGKVTFSIEGRSPALFSFTLNKTEKPGLMTLTKTGMQLELYPQVTGRHTLAIYTKAYDSSKESYDNVVEYIVYCRSVDPVFMIPKELDVIVGPSWLTDKRGFLQLTCRDPVINTHDGRCTFGLTLAKRNIVVATLHGDQIRSGDERRYVLQTQRGNRVEFKVHLPQAGYYALKLLSSTGPGKFECFCNYLIICTNPEVVWPPFPNKLQNPVGPTALMEKKGILKPSCNDPIIYTHTGQVSISFTLKDDIKILPALQCDDVSFNDCGDKRHVTQVQRGHHIELQVRLPKTGSYVLQIFADSKSSPTNFEYTCNYLICCSGIETSGPGVTAIPQIPVGSSNSADKKSFIQPSQLGQVINSTDGRCSLSFSLDRDMSCLATLHSDDNKWNSQMERRYILQIQKKHQAEFYIQLPRPGTFDLRIYADNKFQPGSYELVCSYLISCSNPKAAWPPFPNILQNPVGPTSLSEKKGLLQPSQTEPIIHTSDGRCSVSFTLKKEMGIFARLQSEDVLLTEEGERRHILQIQKQNRVEFQVRLPQAGMYVLKIYTESEQGNFKFACNYLITCVNTQVNWPLLPLELCNPAGPSYISEKKGLLRPSHLEPAIFTDDGRCCVSFALDESTDIVATLHSDDITTEEARRRYIFQLEKEGRVEFHIQLPKAGYYVLKMCTKMKTDLSNVYDYACNYLLYCSNTKIRWPFFPMRYNGWNSGYELIEPKTGVLPANTEVRFRIKARGLAAVSVKGKNFWPLTLGHDECWEGVCSTAGTKDIQVLVTNNLNKNHALVLSYQVKGVGHSRLIESSYSS
ncbi:kyphoscoliosis peptidase-like isoform X1 [Rana temporaria]|uniref:kyphoscoliosis peptidase-like isoform X1 n=1 Tax=Rana temporaria TaxID=8407 RepID=UPI001AAD3E64|nr:kyphoscoliosis peptidase-like isoform X1 [Rana temporaria]